MGIIHTFVAVIWVEYLSDFLHRYDVSASTIFHSANLFAIQISPNSGHDKNWYIVAGRLQQTLHMDSYTFTADFTKCINPLSFRQYLPQANKAHDFEFVSESGVFAKLIIKLC
jgi:hypothetical protein